ncbi:MAG: Fe-S cluster assembly protein SufB [Nitrospiraceae bacterium]|nr:Fe-S cluster assembly protein SufB [Nitrospiraceae bacterium]
MVQELNNIKGINEEVVRQISKAKNEPKWMLDIRLKSLKIFQAFPMPTWGPDLSKLDFNQIVPYLLGIKKTSVDSWEELPENIKKIYDDLGLIKEEQEQLAGLGAQYQSEVVYNKIKETLSEKGIIFTSMDEAVKKYPDLVKKYFHKCTPPTDNKFAALNGAVWSGGSFIYIPKGVKLQMPLQGYFYVANSNIGQFEHSLIIVEDNAYLHYIEGCSAPQYSKLNLHSGSVEVFVGKNSRMRFTSVQNWAKNIYSLSNKRAIVDENSIMEWVSGSLGSGVTMIYPSTVLKGKNSKASHLSLTLSSSHQNIDSGTKVYHLAPNTTSIIKSKSVSLNGGISNYRGFVKISKKAINSKTSVSCDSLIVDSQSKSKSYPSMKIENSKSIAVHEAKVGKISNTALFYLMSRGISKDDATEMIVNGFIQPIMKSIPFEYAIEFNKLLSLELNESIENKN